MKINGECDMRGNSSSYLQTRLQNTNLHYSLEDGFFLTVMAWLHKIIIIILLGIYNCMPL